MKKVSIIVPVYNMEKYLNQCMDSLVNQTLSDIEIIAINDGSTDNSIKILNEYQKKYFDKIKIIDQENEGISVARNNGIKIATGKYIGFVDSDDYVELDMFEKLYNKIEQTKSDIVVCDFREYRDIDNSFKHIEVIKNITKENIYDDLSIINSIDYGPCNKLFKRELFKDIRFPEGIKYEDLSTILKIFLISKKISTVNKDLYIYRMNQYGETKTVNRKVTDILIILQDIIDFSKTINVFEIIKDELKKLCVGKLFYYLIYSYKINDLNFTIEFRHKIIQFLKNNFGSWRYTLLKNKSIELKFISKLILINNIVFKLFITRKLNK